MLNRRNNDPCSQLRPPPGKGRPLPSPFDTSQSQALGSIAAGASTVFLLGTLATVLLNLFPLQLGNSQWQLSQMGNLVANGSWLLLGLVLLHLAAALQPSKARLGRRLATARRLASFVAVLFLALTPLQLVATWNGIDIADTTRNRVVSTTVVRVKLLREAISKARNLADLKQRAATIPDAPPIPPEAATLPFETLRRTLLGQLDVVESNVRRQLGQSNPPAGQQAIWLQAIRGALTSLLLALGFATGANGRDGKPFLMDFTGESQLPDSKVSLLDAFCESLFRRYQQGLRKRDERIRFRDHLRAEARAKEEQQTPPDPSLDFAPQAHGLLLHSFLLHRAGPADTQLDRDGDLMNTRTPDQRQEAGVLPAVLRFVSSQDPDLHIDAELLPDGSGSLLRFNRAVMPLSFSFGPLPQRGQPTSFSFAQADHRSEQGPMDWWEDFDYPLAEPFPLEPALPLELVGAAPEALLQHHNPHGLLPIAVLKAEEPHPGFLQVLGEEWQIWRSRLGGLWDGSSASKP